MAKIAVLDQSTIDKIAAGEVVERPASVVKELLENAIDAKASAVTVEIKDGGTTLIRVTDNGCGIEKDEVRLAFCRHATSKIQTADDLMTVSSLGFRGEALSSIAAVSQVEFITKTSDTLVGVRYCIEGGIEKSFEEVGVPEGTTFLVRNLFYNTPVRKKFLKSNQTEGAYVADMVQKIAMSHPEVSIRLILNNQNKIHTSGNHNIKDMIYALYGREIAANLLPVEYTQDPVVQVNGFAGKPVIARGNRNLENYYINGRYIKSSLIFKAIEDAYKPYMMQHMYPFVVLQITAAPTFLDVNVHPTKMDVRFGNGDVIYRAVYEALSQALAGKELIPNVEISGKENAKEKPQRLPIGMELTGKQKESLGKETSGAQTEKSILERAERPERKAQEQTEKPIIRESEIRKRVSGNLGEKIEKTEVKLTEKAAAGTEKLWEDLVNQAAGQKGQKMAPAAGVNDAPKAKKTEIAMPEPFEKHRQQAQPVCQEIKETSEVYGEQQNLFEQKLLSKPARSEHRLIGQLFDTYWLIEYRDQLYIIDQHAAHEKVLYERTMKSLKTREYTSQQISPPMILTLTPQEQVLLEENRKQLEQIGFEIEPFGDTEYAVYAVPDNLFSIAKKELLLEMIGGLSQDLVLEKVASMSCKAAVKGKHKMSPQEADMLIDELLKLENPYACPHGRPTIISMSKYELEKKFKRIL